MRLGRPSELPSAVPEALKPFISPTEWGMAVTELKRIHGKAHCMACTVIGCTICTIVSVCYYWLFLKKFMLYDISKVVSRLNSNHFGGTAILTVDPNCDLHYADDRLDALLPQQQEDSPQASESRRQMGQQPQMIQPQPQMMYGQTPQGQMMYAQAPQGQMMYAQAPQGQMMYGQMPQGQMMYGGQEQPMIVAQPQHAAPHAVAPAPMSMIGASSM